MSLKKAVVINAVSRYTTVLFSLIFNIILARILSPEDYGVVVVVNIFVTFFNLIADMGIGTGVIQNKGLTSNDINNIFTYTARLSGVLGATFSILTFAISKLYKNQVYIPIGILLAVSLMFNTLNMVPHSLLMKEKRFVTVGFRTVIVNVLTGIVGVSLALIGFKYYALVIQSVFNAIAIFIWDYIPTHPKITTKYNKASILKIRNFSAFQFGFNIVNYFSRNLDTILTGKFMGDVMVGYYDKAYKLMLYPISNLTGVITSVLHPVLSDYQNDKQYIYNKYMDIVKLLSLLGIFVTPFCFVAGREIITIMFGEKWESTIPCFQYLSLAIWAQLLLTTTGSIFQSIGNTRLLFITGCATTVLMTVCIIEGLAEESIISISRNVAISYNVQLLFSYYMLINKAFGYRFMSFIKNIIPNICIMIIMIIFGCIIKYKIHTSDIEGNILLCFVIKLIIMLIFYMFFIWITKQHKFILKFIHRR